jgi:hypothetical protein
VTNELLKAVESAISLIDNGDAAKARGVLDAAAGEAIDANDLTPRISDDVCDRMLAAAGKVNVTEDCERVANWLTSERAFVFGMIVYSAGGTGCFKLTNAEWTDFERDELKELAGAIESACCWMRRNTRVCPTGEAIVDAIRQYLDWCEGEDARMAREEAEAVAEFERREGSVRL